MSEADVILDRLARRIQELRMTSPAIFFLEMYKPLLNLMHSTAIVGTPLIHAVIGEQQAAQLREALQSREKVEALIRRLEGRQA
jgi:hypothetical protein